MCVFFFKQKAAYEMRISDWSSDVCSSDLNGKLPLLEAGTQQRSDRTSRRHEPVIDPTNPCAATIASSGSGGAHVIKGIRFAHVRRTADRSEERRVGKKCVSQCRCRGWQSI